MILRRPAGPRRVEEVRRFLHRRRGQGAFGPYAGEPADQPHHDTSTTAHHARKRIRPDIQPPLPPMPVCATWRVRVVSARCEWLSRLATYSPLVGLCTLRCMRAVFPALKFITCSRGTSKAPAALWLYKGRPSRLAIIFINALYIYTRQAQLLFRVRRPCF